jgi:flagellar motility protein MotE (MotC chaperone)
MRLEHVRLLPLTIGVMALVLVIKGMTLAGMAYGADPGRPAATAPAAAPAPAASASPPPPGDTKRDAEVSPAERSVLLDLRRRREALDLRERQLDARAAEISATETKLSQRLNELAALQSRLEQLEAERHAHDEANWSGLVKTYEAMKPRDAAAIFNDLDTQVLLPVLDRMNERKAAPILAAMQPDRARLATQMLAEMRTRSTAASSAPVATGKR